MSEAPRLASPPPKPLLVFDGDCNFCRRWISRWQQATGDRVDYLPFQDPRVRDNFPELPRENFELAVHLLEPDGRVYHGAEAVFRSLACVRRWPLWLYLQVPGAAPVADAAYGFVARHRQLFSALTRWCWGEHVERPSHILTRWLFLRALGGIYLIAFASLWTQIIGLVGENGILPAKQYIRALHDGAEQQHIGLDLYHLEPTLCWLNSEDGFLKLQCAAGVILSLLLVAGVAPAPCLFLLWLIYLSLTSVCRVFLGYQWDNLLLEVGFLAIFFAPLQLWSYVRREARPSTVLLWLLRWLLFRLMFASGCVKLVSGDQTWHNFTALNFHYETQPLPTWIGWYAHQLPAWIQKASTGLMFFVELVVPFLIFLPRRLRIAAVWPLLGLQLVIVLTGNYCFFNVLTVALCLLLFDDAALLKFVPSKWRDRCACFFTPTTTVPTSHRWPFFFGRLHQSMVGIVAVVILTLSTMFMIGMFHRRVSWPKPMIGLYRWTSPFRSVNSYGLFAVMTTSRLEIIVEGSTDGQDWRAYEFKYKPGNLSRRPGFVAPHQPRLDWQMWFAALGTYRQNPWFINFCHRLLEGSPEVLALLDHNPFPEKPPQYIRAVVYEYDFTDRARRHADGSWWRREFKGYYCPTLSLRDMGESPARNGPPKL